MLNLLLVLHKNLKEVKIALCYHKKKIQYKASRSSIKLSVACLSPCFTKVFL